VIATRVTGSATLRFARLGKRTRLVYSHVRAPAAVVRPFELPDGRLVVQLVTVGPGLCAGDAIHMDVTAEEGSEVVLTTAAATRIMGMDVHERADQHIRLRAGRAASLEYYPALTIPFPGCALTQTLAIEADAMARIGIVERWALGRSARDEYLQFRSLSSRTTLTIGGTLVYADALQLEPAVHDVANAAVLDRRRYLAAGVFSGVEAVPTFEPAPTPPDVDVALALSRPGLAYLRALASDAPALDACVQSSIERIALAWGRPAARLDRFQC
jgi:urease accessory protein